MVLGTFFVLMFLMGFTVFVLLDLLLVIFWFTFFVGDVVDDGMAFVVCLRCCFDEEAFEIDRSLREGL